MCSQRLGALPDLGEEVQSADRFKSGVNLWQHEQKKCGNPRGMESSFYWVKRESKVTDERGLM